MIGWRKIGPLLVGGLAVAGAGALLPQPAEAHGRGHGHAFVGGFYGFAPFYGFGAGFGPYWGPYWGGYWGPWPGLYYGPEGGGVNMNVAMMAGFGAVDLDVKPNRAEVWVDGEYAGEARDLDGYPSYLWLEQGSHHVEIYKGGYATIKEDIAVRRGMKTNLKFRMVQGESGPPPGTRPDEQKNKKDKKDDVKS
jgi:PEGA domain